MKKWLTGFLFLSFLQQSEAQQADTVYFDFTTQQNRQQLYKQMVDTTIYQYLAEPPSDTTEGEWNEAFWSIELLMYKNDFVKKKLTEAWNVAGGLSEYFQKNLLEATYSIYPTEFKEPVTRLLTSTSSVPVFIRCAEYLIQADSSEAVKILIQDLVNTTFKDDSSNGLYLLQSRLAGNSELKVPPLKDIFSKDFLSGQTVIYSLQRKNRAYAGLVVIRKPDGTFLRNTDGSLFHAYQLARALANYPFYITNGNTPQGILRWTGFEVSKLSFVGPTPNLQLSLPFEANPAIFFNDSSLQNSDWQKEMYAALLPASWKNYDGAYESFYAGIMGRNAIIMHGTTVDPAYYKGESYYPQTPSLGCLCSYEEWDKTGRRIKSNQQEIDDALKSINASCGYVMVIDIDDAKKPVTVNDVKKYFD